MSDEMQHAVITGGTGTLGRALASFLQSPGWSVAALGSRDLDVRNRAAVQEYFGGRKTNLLICAAGVTHDAPLARLSANAWDKTWDVNFKGAAFCADAVLPGMLEQNAGHIVFISSFSALHPPAGQAAYASAKAALLGLVTQLAARHGPSNIRVNAVLPGFLQTKMTASVTDRRRAEILAAHTLGRFNTCHEAARFIRFLHHEMPHTSGQVFQLDSRPTP
jgi:3-oxoacyl-[acyl-carrier protein] reductase